MYNFYLKAENIEVATIHHSNLIRANTWKRDTTFQFPEQDDPSELHFFDLDSILIATDNFSITNKLGQGGFGSVYKVIGFFIEEKLMILY